LDERRIDQLAVGVVIKHFKLDAVLVEDHATIARR
jgi:hypothetical protein